MSPNPSQQQSHHSSLHYHRCWWAFCRHSFYSTVELQEHVNLEHVQNARPERLRDVPVHKLVEDDYWDSFDISSPPQVPAAPFPQQPESGQGAACEPISLNHVFSSLPSPPASTPHPSPLASTSHPSPPASSPHQTPSTPPRAEPVNIPVSPNTPAVLLLKAPAFLNGLLTPSSKRDIRVLTPTFSSLRSQPNSPSASNLCVPDSPPFGRLVEEAVSAIKSARSASSCEDISGGGHSSQDSVFNLLTKIISDEENDVEGIDSTKGSEECISVDSSHSSAANYLKTHTDQRSPTSHSSSLGLSHSRPMSSNHLVHPDSLSYPSSLASPIGIGTPMARQFWYQGFRRQPHRRTLVPDSRQSRSLQLDTACTASPVPCSDVVHPNTSAASPVSPVPPVSQSSTGTNQPQFERPRMQMNSQLTTSYPPLLTQAPYHSQDMTQSQD